VDHDRLPTVLRSNQNCSAQAPSGSSITIAGANTSSEWGAGPATRPNEDDHPSDHPDDHPGDEARLAAALGGCLDAGHLLEALARKRSARDVLLAEIRRRLDRASSAAAETSGAFEEDDACCPCPRIGPIRDARPEAPPAESITAADVDLCLV
jgi:hypothetical protein